MSTLERAKHLRAHLAILVGNDMTAVRRRWGDQMSTAPNLPLQETVYSRHSNDTKIHSEAFEND